MADFKYNPERPFSDNPDLHLIYWGKEDCAPGHSFGPGIRDVYKVHFIHKGTGIVRTGDRTYTLRPGQAFLAFPGKVIYYEADSTDPWTYSWIAFKGAQAEQILSRTALTAEAPVFPMDVRVMPSLYEQLTSAAAHPGNRDLRLTGMLYEFMSVLVDASPRCSEGGRNPGKRDAYIHQSMEFLHAHFCEDITVQQLASALGLDRKYLSAIFKEATSLPPQQYLLHYRMNKARELLQAGGLSVGEVARSVGYRDALLFSRMFKKIHGASPRNFQPHAALTT